MSILGNKLTGKSFVHKVYNRAGTYLTSWCPEKEVMNVPSFTWSINSGMGNMSVKLARPINNFGENVDVRFFNRVQTYILDENGAEGVKIYDGIILSYEPIISKTGEQYIKINLYSQSVTLQDRLVEDASDNTTVTYSTTPVSDIIKNLLDLYNGVVTYNATSIDDVSDSVTYTFSYITYYNAIKKCLELAPAYWYWYLAPDNLLHLHSADWDTISHVLYLGKHISAVNAKKSLEEYYSDVFFLGAVDSVTEENLYLRKTYSDAATDWKERHYQKRDTRVSVQATAEAMMDKVLNENSYPTSEMTVTVLDDSVNTEKGYDIETFKPGDVVHVLEPQSELERSLWDQVDWDVARWDFSILQSFNQILQIKSINYNFFNTTLSLESKPEEIDARINNIDRNLEVLESEAIPTQPTIIT